MAYGVITEEGIADLRSRIGREHALRVWSELTTIDTIRHFADGLGDANPLWRDEEHARRTRWGGLIAPPFYLFTAAPLGITAGGLPGVHSLWMNDVWEFYRPLRPGDRLTAVSRLKDVIETPSSFGGRAVRVLVEYLFRDETGQLYGKKVQTSLRAERGKSREKGKYADMTSRYRYAEAEIQAIEEAQDREEIRGASPRFWEEVKEGEELRPVVRGPLTVREMMAFRMGGIPGAFILAGALARDYHRRHPGARILHPETGVPEFPVSAHWDDGIARHSGMPMAYDLGVQRISWMGNLLTNWMGDDGWLKTCEVQMRLPVFQGDTTWCRGRVVKKYVEGAEHLAECEIWGDDQRGRRTTTGSATVSLPARG